MKKKLMNNAISHEELLGTKLYLMNKKIMNKAISDEELLRTKLNLMKNF